MKSVSYFLNAIVLGFLLLPSSNTFAYESITTGDSFSTNKADACTKALDQAREAAAQQARVYVSSKYERRIKLLSGEVVDDVTHQTYQSTFGITVLEEIIYKESKYDEKTGSISCHIKAKFDVDSDAVSKELEARISLEEAKIKEAKRRSVLLATLEFNKNKYTELKDNSNQFSTAIYTASVICKESNSVRLCKNELTDKFEKDKSVEISQDLNVANKYVSVSFNNFDGDEEHKAMDEYEGTFVISMTGTFNYKVDIHDPYVEENNQIINELALGNSRKLNDINSHDQVNSWKDVEADEIEYGSDSSSILSNIMFDVALIKGDLLGYDELISEGKTQAYIDSLVQFGIIFDVGDAYSKNLFKVSLYSGTINIHTCLSSGTGDTSECSSLSTIDTTVKGIGVEKVFENSLAFMNFGGVFYKVEDKDIIGTDFFQIKIGVSSKGAGPYVYADMYSIFQTSSKSNADIQSSIDLSIGVGVRF